MGEKTVLKHLLSKFGLLSIELQKALQDDQATFNEKMERDYIDSTSEEVKNVSVEEVKEEQAQKSASVVVEENEPEPEAPKEEFGSFGGMFDK